MWSMISYSWTKLSPNGQPAIILQIAIVEVFLFKRSYSVYTIVSVHPSVRPYKYDQLQLDKTESKRTTSNYSTDSYCGGISF